MFTYQRKDEESFKAFLGGKNKEMAFLAHTCALLLQSATCREYHLKVVRDTKQRKVRHVLKSKQETGRGRGIGVGGRGVAT